VPKKYEIPFLTLVDENIEILLWGLWIWEDPNVKFIREIESPYSKISIFSSTGIKN